MLVHFRFPHFLKIHEKYAGIDVLVAVNAHGIFHVQGNLRHVHHRKIRACANVIVSNFRVKKLR